MEENKNTGNAENVTELENTPVDTPDSAQQPAEDKEKESSEKKGSFLGDILEIVESVVISIFVVLLLFTFVARPVTVDGKSMYPTLDDQDKLVMWTICYSPKPGDIVVVDNHVSYTYEPGTQKVVEGSSLNKRIIKRVIALGGQTVDINFETGEVRVDGELHTEDYIADLTHFNAGAFEYPVTVPEGYVFVMGDNRNNSTDSRAPHVGFVKEEDILGEAVIRFYPFDKLKWLD